MSITPRTAVWNTLHTKVIAKLVLNAILLAIGLMRLKLTALVI